jgi:hypothetical protein
MMRIEIQRLKQVTAGIFVVLSLFVSSIAACTCAHHSHPEKVEVEPISCHGQVDNEKTVAQPAGTDSADASCECFLPSPSKVFVKSEKLKIEKQAVAVIQTSPVIDLISATTTLRPANFHSGMIFVSRDFHNLTPGRAPPRL